MISPLQYLTGAALLAALAFGGVQCSQKQRANLRATNAEANLTAYKAEASAKVAQFEREARQQEQRHSADMARIEQEARQRAKEAGDAAYNRAVADVRAGRLRNVWTCPAASAVSGAGGPASERDGGADARAAAVGAVLRLGAEYDQRLRACQAVIQADRAMRIPE